MDLAINRPYNPLRQWSHMAEERVQRRLAAILAADCDEIPTVCLWHICDVLVPSNRVRVLRA